MLYVIVVWYAFSWAICTHYVSISIHYKFLLQSNCIVVVFHFFRNDSFYYLNFFLFYIFLSLFPTSTSLLWRLTVTTAAGPSILFMFYELIDHYYGIFRLLLFLLFRLFIRLLSVYVFLLYRGSFCAFSFFILFISFLLRFLFMSHLMTMLKANHIE